jgi:hypothetical protein
VTRSSIIWFGRICGLGRGWLSSVGFGLGQNGRREMLTVLVSPGPGSVNLKPKPSSIRKRTVSSSLIRLPASRSLELED